MKSKQQTPLGYLMVLLDVSLADLGDYLYVAQSSISKWKTGARVLKPSSQYFEGIVEYFTALERDPDRADKLHRLFSQLYPGQTGQEAGNTARNIRLFLGGSLLPPVAVQQAIGEAGRLYTAEVGVYAGDKGYAAAQAQLIAYIAEQERHTPVRIVSRGDVAAFSRFAPLAVSIDRMRMLLQLPAKDCLLMDCMALFAHPAADICLLPKDAPYPLGSDTYIVGEGMVLFGLDTGAAPAYAAVYMDPLTIQQYTGVFDSVWAQSSPLFTAIQPGQLGEQLYRQAIDTTLGERLDWLLPSLPYLTMSRTLLMEVLRANRVSGRDWTRILSGYDALHGMKMRLLVPAHALQLPAMTMPCLSLLCGREIRITSVQAKRHQMDTAALLRAGSGVQVVPIQGAAPDAWAHVSAFVKRNVFAGYLHFAPASVKVTVNPAFVDTMMAAMDALYSALTPEAASPAYVAQHLEAAALG